MLSSCWFQSQSNEHDAGNLSETQPTNGTHEGTIDGFYLFNSFFYCCYVAFDDSDCFIERGRFLCGWRGYFGDHPWSLNSLIFKYYR